MPQGAGRPEQPLDVTAGPLARLAGELRQLRGTRTYRELAQLTNLSVGTLQAAAKGERLPSLRVAEAFAAACDGPAAVRTVRELWKDACAAEGRPVPDDPPETPPVPEPGSVTSGAEFIAMMNQLRAWAGTPSYAELNRRAPGHNLLPPATVSDVLRGQRLPRQLSFVLAFVRACGLNDEQAAAWEQAWSALREREFTPAGSPLAQITPQRPSWTVRALAGREAVRFASRNFLVWLSGARPELLKHSRTDRLAYSGLGAAILITGLIAAVSAAFALQTALYITSPYAALLGAAWGAAIMTVDRWVVFTIRRGSHWKIVLTVLPRLALSLLLAVIFAMPLLLRMFAPEISAQLAGMRQAAAAQATSAITHSAVGAEVTDLQRQLNADQARADTAYRQWQCQLYGGCGNHRGSGAAAGSAQADYQAATKDVNVVSAELSLARSELTTLQRQSSTVILRGPPGLLERFDALDQATAGSTVLAATRILLLLFFFVIGCLPVIVRAVQVIGPQGSYETILKMQERADIQSASLQIRNQSPRPVQGTSGPGRARNSASRSERMISSGRQPGSARVLHPPGQLVLCG
jgi:hypothetical protein